MKIQQQFDRMFKGPAENKGKLCSLREAIQNYIKAGMKLHFAGGIGGPSAAICEIVRQFFGKNPEFTIIQSTCSGYALVIIHLKLAKRVIFSAAMDISSSARPSKIVQRAYQEKHIQFENWSLLSLQQRLMGGAMGFPFIPTKSIVSSSIALDNSESFIETEDPFGSGRTIGLLKSLNPDVSIVHGCAADLDGNVILPVPYGDDIWGSLASKGGVIATVEKVVSSDFVRKYSSMVKIPGYMVRAVCVVPLGLHPFPLANPGIKDLDPYEMDLEFLEIFSKASKIEGKLNEWVKTWILDCLDHKDYLEKLGKERIETLKRKAKDHGNDLVQKKERKICCDEDFISVAIAREIIEAVRSMDHKLVLAGASSKIVNGVFLAYMLLKNRCYEVELITGNGQVGFIPDLKAVNLSNEKTVRNSKMLTDTIMTHGVFVAGESSRCLSVIGAGQIDKFGNINSTFGSDGQFLVGSGGSNDALNAREVFIIVDQSKERFVDKLPYVTGSGKNVTTVISTMGIYKKSKENAELELVACFPYKGLTIEERIKRIQDNCGWPLKIRPNIAELEVPSKEELEILSTCGAHR